MKRVSPQIHLPLVEHQILAWWRETDMFRRSLEHREGQKEFFFYDGPPFATGLPHYGHLLQGTTKDIIPRYQTMKGCHVERRFGWDCHGLPIEMITEKTLSLKGREDILAYGVDKFNEACRQGVFRYVEDWERVTERLGRWIDFRNDYKTLDTTFMESVWWVFGELWKQGRVYEGHRVMPFSWRLSTPLSNFEASKDYRTVQDPAITVSFPILERPGIELLAWTTTPWTLPSNLALCVGPEIDYVQVLYQGKRYIVAASRLDVIFPDAGARTVEATMLGSSLEGLSYEPLFPYFKNLREAGAFRVLSDPYVTTDDGTGIVHQSPAHGEDDYRVCARHQIPLVDPVDVSGNFNELAPDFVGINIKEADRLIIRALKDRGRLFAQATIEHSYPFCERSGTPLIYKAITAWYVRVEDLRDEMVALNETIHWVPEAIGKGRFGNWIREARDWNISRNRFWGTPIPVWRCDCCGATECVASQETLEERSGTKVTDLHKHIVDTLSWRCSACESGVMNRVPEVLDCWFESGSMPYGYLHYPFENREKFERVFPADFIAEALDQTRGWFYTLLVLSTALFKRAPFRNVIVSGMILAEDGRKMSKSLANYPDPMGVMEEYGADALRLYMVTSPVVRGEPLRFSEAGVKDIVRSVLLPYWNAYSFLTTYGEVDKYQPSPGLFDEQDSSAALGEVVSHNILDAWIVSRFQSLLADIEREMGEYRLYNVTPALLVFLEDLTNWYVRRSRRRFWSDNAIDKQAGYDTLFWVLLNFTKVLAPFTPFITEEVYRNLASLVPNAPESVHLCDYPCTAPALISSELEGGMALIQRAVELGRSLRTRLTLRIRQPLASLTVVTRDARAAQWLRDYGEQIREELNVKEILFSDDEGSVVDLKVKPLFPVLGPRFGAQMRELTATLQRLSASEIAAFEEAGAIEVLGQTVHLSEVAITRTPKAKLEVETALGVTVFFDTTLTPDLIAEGRARELVSRIQKMRKDADLAVSDRIEVVVLADSELELHLKAHLDYIAGEVLATDISFSLSEVAEFLREEQTEIDELPLRVAINRAVGESSSSAAN